MNAIFAIDWREILVPQHSPLEMIVRGTVMYLGMFLLLRFFGRRPNGSMSTADLLMIVVIADAAQNAMSSDYKSITEGAVLVGTIVAWDYALDWLAFRSKLMARILQPSALPLVREGRMQRRNMQREMITKDELMSQLRENGIESLEEVKLAQLEGDGQISVLTHDTPGNGRRNRRG